MNWNVIKGYFLVLLGSLFFLAAILLLISQGATRCTFSVYWFKEFRDATPVSLLMLLSAVGGIILVFCMRIMFSGLHSVKKGRQELAGNRKLIDLHRGEIQNKPL